MPHRNRQRRPALAINAGSMADIAFLLLIFFLVTTTLANEQGLRIRLPQWEDEPPVVEGISPRNLFTVLVNEVDQLRVRDEPIPLTELKDRAKEFILNPQQKPNLSRSPNKALISLVHHRGTSYARYLGVYNELKAAYHEIWEALAQQHYGRKYSTLDEPSKKYIQTIVPMIISEAEAFGEGEVR